MNVVAKAMPRSVFSGTHSSKLDFLIAGKNIIYMHL